MVEIPGITVILFSLGIFLYCAGFFVERLVRHRKIKAIQRTWPIEIIRLQRLSDLAPAGLYAVSENAKEVANWLWARDRNDYLIVVNGHELEWGNIHFVEEIEEAIEAMLSG